MDAKSRKFEDVIVWQKAHKFVLNIYKMTEHLPKHELYGLTSQIRRSSVSIAANFAEGFQKRTSIDKARYYNIAQGSLNEARYYLILIRDLRYYTENNLLEDINEVGRMLDSYMKSIF